MVSLKGDGVNNKKAILMIPILAVVSWCHKPNVCCYYQYQADLGAKSVGANIMLCYWRHHSGVTARMAYRRADVLVLILDAPVKNDSNQLFTHNHMKSHGLPKPNRLLPGHPRLCRKLSSQLTPYFMR
jgi:hypothetical protein